MCIRKLLAWSKEQLWAYLPAPDCSREPCVPASLVPTEQRADLDVGS